MSCLSHQLWEVELIRIVTDFLAYGITLCGFCLSEAVRLLTVANSRQWRGARETSLLIADDYLHRRHDCNWFLNEAAV